MSLLSDKEDTFLLLCMESDRRFTTESRFRIKIEEVVCNVYFPFLTPRFKSTYKWLGKGRLVLRYSDPHTTLHFRDIIAC